MKRIIYIPLILLVVSFLSCSKDLQVEKSVPTISRVETVGAVIAVTVPSTVSFNVTVEDAVRPLSTLDIEVLINDLVVESRSIRTKGHRATVENEAIAIPFVKDMDPVEDVVVRFTSINVDGDHATKDIIIKATRPILPSTLYYLIEGASPILLTNSIANPFVYKSAEGIFESKVSGKIATESSLVDADFIWGKGRYESESAIVGSTGDDIEFDYTGMIVKQIIFDAQTFLIDVQGDVATKITLNPRNDATDSEMKSAIVSLKKGQFLEIAGVNMESNLNPDFFNHSASSKIYEFLGEDGDWEIIYSPKYKGLWVTRLQDEAPTNYWVVGHGFTTATSWHADYKGIGWDLDDFKQVAYARKIEEKVYQATVFISNEHDWESFEFQFYSNRTWEAVPAEFSAASILGDKQGFSIGAPIAGKPGKSISITNASGFVPGYYRLVLDLGQGVEKATVHITKIN
ncbi:DUF5016 domain-containing protein [Sphingobacterium tabacisoli]|uniref:DUF5016 domain-containing protein n=1 Tax=Sphingobacterium tabacisoli TaxID=2044855 RepID=A0ABW5L4V5_9SPHI|nr:DUF5016 domain-containing protein [Sphingobacterium tabacisoli]